MTERAAPAAGLPGWAAAEHPPPLEAAYQRWLLAEPPPGWDQASEGDRIKAAFWGGWCAGFSYLAGRLAGEVRQAGAPDATEGAPAGAGGAGGGGGLGG